MEMSVESFLYKTLEYVTHAEVLSTQVVLPEGTDYGSFVIPDCPECLLENRANNMEKPDLIFFGESIPATVKSKS